MILALMLGAATPAAACSLTAPQACASASEVLAAPGAVEGIRAIAGERRGNFLRDGLPLVADQAIEVLHGIPEKPRRIANGWLFGACRQASCGEMAAVIVDAKGKIASFAVLHGACPLDVTRPGCARALTLSIWGGDDVVNWRGLLTDWATRYSSGVVDDVFLNGENEPVITAVGEFDGDRVPDKAAFASLGDSWQVTINRGVEPGKAVVVATTAQPAGYTLKATPAGLVYGPPGMLSRAQWNGSRFATRAPAQ